MITNVDRDGSGLYKCRALNGIGEPAIKTYRLTVQGTCLYDCCYRIFNLSQGDNYVTVDMIWQKVKYL